MFCSNCGFENSTNNNYCPKCGQPINEIHIDKSQAEKSGFCTECGQKATLNYCSNCGNKTINIEIKKNAFNPNKILEGKSINKDAFKNIKNSSFIENIIKQLRNKESIKRYIVTSVIALLVTYVFSLLAFLIITNIGDIKSSFAQAKASSFPLPNFLDIGNLFWLLQLKLKLDVTAGSHFVYKLFFSIHLVVLLIVPFLSVYLSNRYLKKEYEVTFIDRLLVSAMFSIIFNIVAFIDTHHYKMDYFGTSLKLTYGASLLRNFIIVFILYLLFSVIIDYKTLLNLEKAKKNTIINVLLHSFDLVKNILIYSTFIIIVSFIVAVIAFKISPRMLLTSLLILPNILVDGINFFLGGVFKISATNANVSYSALEVFKTICNLMVERPIFLISIITYIIFAVGVIYFMARSIIKMIEKKYDIKMLSLFVLFTAVIAQIISLITNFRLAPTISGDVGFIGNEMKIFVKWGYSNFKSFVFTLIFLAIITIIIYFIHESYLNIIERIKDIILKPSKKVIIIAAAVSIILICIQGGIVKKYSYNVAQSLMTDKFNNITYDMQQIFDIFDEVM